MEMGLKYCMETKTTNKIVLKLTRNPRRVMKMKHYLTIWLKHYLTIWFLWKCFERVEMKDSNVEVTLKRIKEFADGTIGNELETSTLRGIRVVKAHKGFLLCDFIIHNGLLDENGNWHVGAIATLIDNISFFAISSFTSSLHATLDFSISYFSTAKVQEEVEVEAKVMGKKDELTSVIVEVRKKEKKELVALGKLWFSAVRRDGKQKWSKL